MKKSFFIIVVSVIGIVLLLFGIRYVVKSNADLSRQDEAVSEYYESLNLPTNADGVLARQLKIHVDDIVDGAILAHVTVASHEFSINQSVKIIFEGDNLPDEIKNIDLYRSQLLNTNQTVEYFPVVIDTATDPVTIVAYNVLGATSTATTTTIAE